MDEVPVAALAPLVVLALAWVAWCWWDIAHGQVRYLPKWAWALVCLLSIPLGVFYLLVGRPPRSPRRPSGGSARLGSDRRRVATLPDTPSFDPWLTGWEVVDLARALVAPEAPAVGVGRVLADAGLAEAAARRVGGYSRGMLQRLGLAATVVGDPAVLLLDEPCSALDPAGRREVLDLVARLSGQVTVLLSTHILADVQQVCDTVGVLRAGRLLYQGSLDELLVGRADWLPSHLVGSLHVLARGGDPGEFLPAAAVTLALGALAVAAANWRLGRRDV